MSIGSLGIIGSAFSKHLCARGFDVCGYDPERARSNLLQRRGGRPLRSAAAVAGRSDVVITALASYGVYEAAYFGSGGIVAGAHRGLIVADVSTMPLERKLSARDRLAKLGVTMLDCPISGTGAQAETGDVAVYASGPRNAVPRAWPVLEGFARKVWSIGEFGAGSKLKYVANHLPGKGSAIDGSYYFYAHYYACQAMWHAGGKYWDDWYVAIRDTLLSSQREDGSWQDPTVGPEFGAAMACIILQMPNNYLPVFAK